MSQRGHATCGMNYSAMPQLQAIPVIVCSAIALGDARLGAATIVRKDADVAARLHVINEPVHRR